ncbi:MAG: polysaccharide deacetylase family protein [Cyanobacteria bacterium J06632_22]
MSGYKQQFSEQPVDRSARAKTPLWQPSLVANQGRIVLSMLLGAAAMQALVIWSEGLQGRSQGSEFTVLSTTIDPLMLPAVNAPTVNASERWPDVVGDPGGTVRDEGAAGALTGMAETTALCPSPLLKASGLGGYWQVGQTWTQNVQRYAQQTVGSFGPVLAAAAQPAQWPEIHTRARRARVPILMYHDILPEMQVFFDVTPEQLEADFELLKEEGLTPISLDQLVRHLRMGTPLPPKPVLLTFDDGYVGHYEHVYRLMRRYNYPATFSIFTAKPDGDIVGRSTVTWEQLQVMAADPLVTIVSHGVNHPPDLRELSDEDLRQELVQSKQRLEEQLGIPIRYFTYPEGNHDERVMAAAADAGYLAALAMDDIDERMAGDSDTLLNLSRFGQSQLENVIDFAWGGPPLASWDATVDFASPIERQKIRDDVSVTFISGGQPVTIHADSRYQVQEIIADTDAIAAVDGAFFSLEYLDSNTMIGPVLSQSTGEFVPGNASENRLLLGRPLVLISETDVKFVPFDPDTHNTLEGVQAVMPDVTDAFVGAAFLVRDNTPQPDESFGDLFDFNAARHRAFWGINEAGQPVVGVTHGPIGSVDLGELLARNGLTDAVMLDSGASTALAYEGESLVGYIPRPVPHVVALVPGGAGLRENGEMKGGAVNCTVLAEVRP